MRDAIARADLSTARVEAAVLAQTGVSGNIEPTWQGKVDAMTRAAARVAQANDLAEGSRGVAAVAGSCGDCHAAFARARRVVVTEPEAASLEVVARMRKHEWAASRLWSGLVIPSSEAWTAGARALGDAPLEPERLVQGKMPDPEIGELTRAIRDLGRRAEAATSADDREAVYGELLTTCSRCHAAMGMTPQSGP
jgi:cytochrome c553